MTAIIKHHIDCENYHCELNHQREASNANEPVSDHDKRVLEAGLGFFTEFFWATDCSSEATRTQLIDYLNHIGVKKSIRKAVERKASEEFSLQDEKA